MCQYPWPHTHTMHPYIEFQIITFHIRHFSLVGWNSTNLLPHGFFIHIYYYNRTMFSCFKWWWPQISIHETKIFTWMHSNILSSLVTRVPTSMATQFFSLPCYNFDRVLEGPPSIMGGPLLTLSCKHAHFLNALHHHAIYENFCSQSLLDWAMYSCHIFVHAFFSPRISIILSC